MTVTLVRILMICAGCVVILLPAWLPNGPDVPISRGTVELLQAFLLAGAAAVMIGAAPHTRAYRPVCMVFALILLAAFVGEIEDFVSEIIGWPFPEVWVIAAILSVALVKIIKHRRMVVYFTVTLGHHAGSGLIAAALLIIYVFNRVIGGSAFWKASLGEAFSPKIAEICKSYLELLACYLIFIGTLGLSLTFARRKEPS
jgi:hypothetical protein